MTAHLPDGLAFVRGLRDGGIRPPPMIGNMPALVVEVEPGRVVLEGAPEPRHDNGVGMAHGGWAMTLLDTAMGLAALTLQAPGFSCVTTDATVRFHKPLRPGEGAVRIVARVLTGHGRTPTTTAVIEAADGAIHVSATAAFTVIERARR